MWAAAKVAEHGEESLLSALPALALRVEAMKATYSAQEARVRTGVDVPSPRSGGKLRDFSDVFWARIQKPVVDSGGETNIYIYIYVYWNWGKHPRLVWQRKGIMGFS